MFARDAYQIQFSPISNVMSRNMLMQFQGLPKSWAWPTDDDNVPAWRQRRRSWVLASADQQTWVISRCHRTHACCVAV